MNIRISFLFAVLALSLPFQNFGLSPKAQGYLKIGGGAVSGVVTVGTAAVAAYYGLENYKNSIRGGNHNYDFSLLLSLCAVGITIPSSILAYVGIKSGITDLRK